MYSIPLWGQVDRYAHNTVVDILVMDGAGWAVYMNRLQWDRDWRNRHQICSIPLWGQVVDIDHRKPLQLVCRSVQMGNCRLQWDPA